MCPPEGRWEVRECAHSCPREGASGQQSPACDCGAPHSAGGRTAAQSLWGPGSKPKVVAPTPLRGQRGDKVSLEWGCTFIAGSLLPQDLGYVTGPGLFGLSCVGLEDVCVAGLPPAKPDLEAQTTVPRVLRQANVCSLVVGGRVSSPSCTRELL